MGDAAPPQPQPQRFRACKVTFRRDADIEETQLTAFIAADHPLADFLEQCSGRIGDWIWYCGEDDWIDNGLAQWLKHVFCIQEPVRALQAFAIMALRAAVQDLVLEPGQLPRGVPIVLEGRPPLCVEMLPPTWRHELGSYKMGGEWSDTDIVDVLRNIKAMEVPRVQWLYNEFVQLCAAAGAPPLPDLLIDVPPERLRPQLEPSRYA